MRGKGEQRSERNTGEKCTEMKGEQGKSEGRKCVRVRGTEKMEKRGEMGKEQRKREIREK